MDPATIVGVLLAFGAIFVSMTMEGGSPTSILLVPPLILVFFGTLGAAMAGGVFKDTVGMVGQLKRAFAGKAPDYAGLLAGIVKLAERARREGLLALEDALNEVDDPFLRRGLELAIDGTDPEALQDLLFAELEAKRRSDKAGAKIFADMGGYAPTVGIIGTVLGLVHVLENLSQPEQLGHLIAAAFVATLWGVLSANALWLPLSSRLKRLSELECAGMELVIEGILAIQAGANPRVVAQKLQSLAPPGSTEQKQAA